MSIQTTLETLVAQALTRAQVAGELTFEELPDVALERPRDEAHGDWASTVALRLAKAAHKNPREIAEIIVAALPENELVAATEIAGPGFINFRLTPAALQGVVAEIRRDRESYGKGEVADGPRRINLEYVSANPTGPMHVGNARWAALGDAMARVLRHAGYEVAEEYYVNDHGVQLDKFAQSVILRYRELCGETVEMPEDSYGGAYVIDVARVIYEADGSKWLNADGAERLAHFREVGYRCMLDALKATLTRFGVHYDCWFSEASLYKPGPDGKSAVDRAFEAMDAKGYLYEKDGATWFRTTEFGDDKDRVLIKENGEYTYFMSDVAYHYDKLARGFDHLIDIWGADHHGYIRRCEAMMAAWGRPGALEVILGQLVNLFRGGEAVRMSKRTGEMVTFDELIDEVGVDATRFLMLQRSSDQMIDFDIEVARREDASNPVYYVQYAHARICSILRRAAGERAAEAVLAHEATMDVLSEEVAPLGCDLSALTDEAELALMRKMDEFPALVAGAARDRAPYRLTHYTQELAGLFHQFYTNCHVLVDDVALRQARLALCDAARVVVALSLNLLGVSAPVAM